MAQSDDGLTRQVRLTTKGLVALAGDMIQWLGEISCRYLLSSESVSTGVLQRMLSTFLAFDWHGFTFPDLSQWFLFSLCLLDSWA